MSDLRHSIKSEKRQRVLDAAARLFERFGPIKTSIADIAREAGMSPANIYNFFPSRDAIYEEIGRQHMASTQEKILAGCESADSFWAKIETIFVTSAQETRNHLKDEKHILQIYALSRSNEWTFISEYFQFIQGLLFKAITAGQRSGEFGELDPDWAASAIFYCMNNALDPLQLVSAEPAENESRILMQLAFLRRALR